MLRDIEEEPGEVPSRFDIVLILLFLREGGKKEVVIIQSIIFSILLSELVKIDLTGMVPYPRVHVC